MSLFRLETVLDDLLRGAVRAVPLALFAPLVVYVFFDADPATAHLGELIALYRSNAALWIGLTTAFICGAWEAVVTAPARRAAWLNAARSRASARAIRGYAYGPARSI